MQKEQRAENICRKNKEQRTQKEERANILCAEKKKTYKEKYKISGKRKYLICGGDEKLKRQKRGKCLQKEN